MLSNLEEIMLAHLGEPDYSLGVSLCNDPYNRLFVMFPNDECELYSLYHDGYLLSFGSFAHVFDKAADRLREIITRVECSLHVL